MRLGSSITFAMLALTLAAQAQGGPIFPPCQDVANVGAGQEAANACQQAFDTFAYTTQQYAIILAAGNIEIGRADALGGFPDFRLALHATGISLFAPSLEVAQIPPGPIASSSIYTQTADYATVAVDGALGIFKGFTLGDLDVGALDAWASLSLIPGKSARGYNVSPSSTAYFAWGGRVGLLQEGKVIPGVGVSYLQRNIPKSKVSAVDVSGNTISVTDLSIDTHAWTATVGKHFGVVGLLLGAGQLHFSSSASVTWDYMSASPPAPVLASATSTQNQYFGEFSLTLGAFDFVLEVGEVLGSDLKTYNSFDPSAGSSRSYASAAITFGHY